MPPRDDTAALALAFRQSAAPPDPDGKDATRALAAAFQARTSAGLAPDEASPAGVTPQQLGSLVRLVDHPSHVEAPVASASATPQESAQPVNFTPDSPQVPPAGTSKTAPPPAAAPPASSARGATARTKAPASTPAPKPQPATALSASAAGTSTPRTKTAPPPVAASKTAATGGSTARAQPATAAVAAASAAADPDRDALRRDQAEIRELKRQIALWEAESAGHSRRIAAEQAKPQPDNAAIQQLLQRIRGTDEEFRANGRQPVPGSLNFKAEEARRRLRVLYQQVEDASRAIATKRAPQPAPPAKARVNPRADHLTRGEPLEGGIDPNYAPPRTPAQRAADLAYAKAHPPRRTPLAEAAYQHAKVPARAARIRADQPHLEDYAEESPPSRYEERYDEYGNSYTVEIPGVSPRTQRVYGGGVPVYDAAKGHAIGKRRVGEHLVDAPVHFAAPGAIDARYETTAQIRRAVTEHKLPPAPELSPIPKERARQEAELRRLQAQIDQYFGALIKTVPPAERPGAGYSWAAQLAHHPEQTARENRVLDQRFTLEGFLHWAADQKLPLSPLQERAIPHLMGYKRMKTGRFTAEMDALHRGLTVTAAIEGLTGPLGLLGEGSGALGNQVLRRLAPGAAETLEQFATTGTGRVLATASRTGGHTATTGAVQPVVDRVTSGRSWEAIQRDPDHWRGLANELGVLGEQAALGYAIGWITGAGGHVVLDAAGRSIARRLLERDLARMRAARAASSGGPTGHAEAVLEARLAELRTMEQVSSNRVPTAQGAPSQTRGKPSGGAARLEATRAAKASAKADLDEALSTFANKLGKSRGLIPGAPDAQAVMDAVRVARALVKLGAATTEHLVEQLKQHLEGHSEEFYQAVARALADEEGWPAPGTAPGAGPPTVGGGFDRQRGRRDASPSSRFWRREEAVRWQGAPPGGSGSEG